MSEDGVQHVRAEKILIACGTRPAHIDGIPVDGQRIFDSDQVHGLYEIPRELMVVGAGIIGLEYASMFAALGVKVTLIDQRPTHPRFCRPGNRRCARVPSAPAGRGFPAW